MKQTIKKIAIYRSSALGDAILATAAISFLRQRHIEAQEITWIGSEPALSLITAAFPDVVPVNIHKYKGFLGFVRLFKQLKNLDLVVNYQKNLKSRALCWLLKVFGRVKTLTYSKRQFFRFQLLLSAQRKKRTLLGKKEGPLTWQYQHCLEVLQNYFLPLTESKDDKKFLARPDLRAIKNLKPQGLSSLLPQKRPFLVLGPGATHATKQAPEQLFLGIMQEFLGSKSDFYGNDKIPCIILGSKNEMAANATLCENLRMIYGDDLEIIDYTGRLALLESAYIVSFAAAVLSNDSALVHIAEALDTPVAALFGPTTEEFGFSPWQAFSQAFSVPLSCRPCSKHGKRPCRFGDKMCFTMISTFAVGQFLVGLFKKNLELETSP